MELSLVPMCVSRYPKNVSLVRGRRVLRFVMAEGTWDSTGACEPTLKLTTDQKGSRSLRFSLSPYLTLFLTLSFTPAAAEPGKPLVCQSAPRFRREPSFLVVASRQVLDGCRWSALLCQRFTSSRRCSSLVHPLWKVSDWEVRRTRCIENNCCSFMFECGRVPCVSRGCMWFVRMRTRRCVNQLRKVRFSHSAKFILIAT